MTDTERLNFVEAWELSIETIQDHGWLGGTPLWRVGGGPWRIDLRTAIDERRELYRSTLEKYVEDNRK